ncbi:MAG TPA: DUF2085 domain-containing protein [Methanomassiliicoccales archaeon]|nr:DUF2085 domain-containing protein [Methanomassiliicoccales archaeon]
MRVPVAKRHMLVIEVILSAVLLAILLAPLTLSAGSIGGLDGRIGTLDHGEDLSDVPWPQRAVYLLGDVNCHQQAERSFFINDNQLPFCARDLGLLAGAVAGLALFILLGRRVSWAWLLALLVPMAVDGVLQAITDYESSNILRLLTGALAGTAAGYGAGMLVGNFFQRPDGEKGMASNDREVR